ncbi:hypothetical protein TB1_046001 [Malus domestica]
MENFFKVITQPSFPWTCKATVNNLFSENFLAWNKNLVKHLFIPEEAKLILSIPISAQDLPNRVLRHFERNVKFSVRSAYHLARRKQELDRASPGGSGMSEEKGTLWKKLWNVCVLGKVKNLSLERMFGFTTHSPQACKKENGS